MIYNKTNPGKPGLFLCANKYLFSISFLDCLFIDKVREM